MQPIQKQMLPNISPEEIKEKAIEIRSEEIDEILGKPPAWILRRGIIMLFLLVGCLLAGSWLFKYPDIINAPIIITSNNPPSPVIARNSGRISGFFVKDKQIVHSGQYLAILENSTKSETIIQLKSLLSIADSMGDSSFMINIKNTTISNPGDLQQSYLNWSNAVTNFHRYMELSFNVKKIKALKEQIALTHIYIEKLRGQNNLQLQNLRISKKQFGRDSVLFSQKVLTPSEFEKAEVSLISSISAYKNTELSLSNAKIQLSQLDQEVIELQLTNENEHRSLINEINSALKTLRSQLDAWELAFVLKSNVDGMVTLGKYWSINQNITAGNQVITIIPLKSETPLGKITLPMQGAGKVKIGQKVNIKLTNYPYIEFGMLRGTVRAISEVPAQGNYYVEVAMNNGLKTNYNKTIAFSSEMSGNAEIITEDMRLLERIIGPVYALIMEKI